MSTPMPLRLVAALCVSGRSIYKHLPGVDAYDSQRDARTFPGGIPVIAHPPCRCWSKTLGHQAKPIDARAEMDLGLWCAEQIQEHGGVLEHPAHSRLFEAAGLPLPNRSAHPFLYTIVVEQFWFGFKTRKLTWLCIAGVPRHQLPAIPLRLVASSHARQSGGSSQSRSRSMPAFAEFLCHVARRTWFSLPEKTEGQDSGHFANRRSNRIVARPILPNSLVRPLLP